MTSTQENNNRKASRRVMILWIVIAALALAGGTYAWFTFKVTTNVEPNSAGSVTSGDASLLISTTRNGEYSTSCKLKLDSSCQVLTPVSTAGLGSFYTAAAQNSKGITMLYSNASSEVKTMALHGRLFMKTEGKALNVYLYQPKMTFGYSKQAIAAMRLGLEINAAGKSYTYIFKLDDMADVSKADKQVTTSEEGVVVKSISSGKPSYIKDPALNISDYTAFEKGKSPRPGKNELLTLSTGTIAQVDYWLYLEGCDENCINTVQKKDVLFSLCFAGTEIH